MLDEQTRLAVKRSVFRATYKKYFSDETIERWLLNFAEEDRLAALQLLDKMNYCDEETFEKFCRHLYRKISEFPRPCFVSLGPATVYGDRAAHVFQATNKISANAFIEITNLKAFNEVEFDGLVFLDDFVGSGTQAIEQYHRVISASGVQTKAKYLVYAPIVACQQGLDNILRATTLQVKWGFNIDPTQRAFYPGFVFGFEECSRQRHRFREYGQKLFPEGPIGYHDAQALFAFYFNTPMSTLPVFWSKEDQWFPIVPRKDTPRSDTVSKAASIVARQGKGRGREFRRLVDGHLSFLKNHEFVRASDLPGNQDIFELLNSQGQICRVNSGDGVAYATIDWGVSYGVLSGKRTLSELASFLSVRGGLISQHLHGSSRFSARRDGAVVTKKVSTKCIVFDWGGTLVDESDLDEMICEFICRVAHDQDETIQNRARLKELLIDLQRDGNWRWYDYEWLGQRFGKDPALLREAHKFHADLIRPFVDFSRLSAQLRAMGKRVVIATNCVRNVLRIRAEILGWNVEELTDSIWTSDRVRQVGDKTHFVSAVCQEADVDPREVLWVGDSYERDMVPAKLFGCHTFYVPRFSVGGGAWGGHALKLNPARYELMRLCIEGGAVDFCAPQCDAVGHVVR